MTDPMTSPTVEMEVQTDRDLTIVVTPLLPYAEQTTPTHADDPPAE